MKKEIRTIVYDYDLGLEAYRLEGFSQPFPKHFHEHYVLGFMETGQRQMFCRNKEYSLRQGGIVLFNPGDSHACAQVGSEAMDYRGFNISQQVMQAWAEEVTGQNGLPGFRENVIYDEKISGCLRRLHEMVMQGGDSLGKEETWLFLLDMLIQKYGQPFGDCVPECRQEIDRACAFMEQHFSEHIYLEQICRQVGLSKSALLRAFTRAKGVTPYRYLENIRINEAKKLLGQGMTPLEAAMGTGFADQSHFTNYFGSFTGLTPGAYREIFCQQTKNKKERDRQEIN